MRIALVHDDFVQTGGAESLFAIIASIWPHAPIYTSLVNWNKLPSTIDRSRVRPSFMQKIPFAAKFYKLLLPLYPFAFESFNFDDYDLVISSTTRFAKSIITKPNTIHICYINSIPRFLWDEKIQKDYLQSPLRILLRPIINWLKRWDKVAAKRVDCYIANSQNVRQSVVKTYGVGSLVVCPFADLNFFRPAKIHNWKLKSQNYFLIVSRLVKWKKIDCAIEAANDSEVNLKIVGEGPDRSRLRQLASNFVIPSPVTPSGCAKERTMLTPRVSDGSWIPNQVRDDRKGEVEFLGKVPKEQLRQLYQNCQALIVTQEEDFGISALEAQACGRPVIAYQKGGIGEIVLQNRTGILFKNQSKEILKDAIQTLTRLKWSVQACRKNALRFSKANFVKELKNKIENYAANS